MEGGERRRDWRSRRVTSGVVTGGQAAGVTGGAREGGEEARICPRGDTEHYG